MIKGKGSVKKGEYAIDPCFSEDLGDGFSNQWGYSEDIADAVTTTDGIVMIDHKSRQFKNLYLLGKGLIDLVRETKIARRNRDEAVKEWRDLVYMSTPDKFSPLGPDGANVRTPVTYKHRMAIHATLLDISTGIRPYFRVEPEDKKKSQSATNMEEFLDALLTETIDFFSLQDKAIGLALDEGTAFYYDCYRVQKRTVRANRMLTPEVAESLGYELPTDKEDWKPGNVISHKDGKSDSRIGQWVETEGEEVVYNAPDLSVISYFDYFQYPANAISPKAAFFCGHEYYKLVSDLQNDAESGYIDKDQLDFCLSNTSLKIINNANKSNITDGADRVSGSGGSNEEDEEDEIVDDSATSLSKESPHSKVGKKSGEVRASATLQLVCVTVPVAVGKKGKLIDVELSIETSTGTVLRAIPLMNPSGRRPYEPLILFSRSNRPYGMPVGQILENVQKEMDTVTNLSLDASALSMTAIVEEKRSSYNRIGQQSFGIGINHWLVDDPQSITVHNFNIPTQDGFMDMKLIDKWGEDITAVSETYAGTGTQGATTATEVSQQLSGSQRRIKVAVARMQTTLKKVANACVEQCRQNMGMLFEKQGMTEEGGFSFGWLSAPDEYSFGQVSPIDFYNALAIFAHGDAENTNEILKKQSAEKIWMAMMQDKEFVGASNVRKWAARKYVFEALGVRNVTEFIGTRKDAQDMDMAEKQNPPPKNPPLPPNVNAEYLSVFLSLNPALAQKTIEMLSLLSRAENTGKDQGAEAKTQGDAQVQRVKNEESMAKQRLQGEAQKRRGEVELKEEQANNSIQRNLQESSHNLQMHQERTRASVGSEIDKIKHAEQLAKAKSQARNRSKNGSR